MTKTDYGLMPVIWFLPCIVLMILGSIGKYSVSLFFVWTGISSVGICILLIFINAWSKERTPSPPVDLHIKNPFRIPLVLGAFASCAIGIDSLPLILRDTDLVFFAAIAGALSCLACLMALGEWET